MSFPHPFPALVDCVPVPFHSVREFLDYTRQNKRVYTPSPFLFSFILHSFSLSPCRLLLSNLQPTPSYWSCACHYLLLRMFYGPLIFLHCHICHALYADSIITHFQLLSCCFLTHPSFSIALVSSVSQASVALAFFLLF